MKARRSCHVAIIRPHVIIAFCLSAVVLISDSTDGLAGNCGPPDSICNTCDASNQNCFSCFAGYGLNTTNPAQIVCQPCGVNCLKCAVIGVKCAKCYNGNIGPDLTGGGCSACSPFCGSCTDTGAGFCDDASCDPGYGVNSSSMCSPCADNCITCANAGAGKCNQCKNGFDRILPSQTCTPVTTTILQTTTTTITQSTSTQPPTTPMAPTINPNAVTSANANGGTGTNTPNGNGGGTGTSNPNGNGGTATGNTNGNNGGTGTNNPNGGGTGSTNTNGNGGGTATNNPNGNGGTATNNPNNGGGTGTNNPNGNGGNSTGNPNERLSNANAATIIGLVCALLTAFFISLCCWFCCRDFLFDDVVYWYDSYDANVTLIESRSRRRFRDYIFTRPSLTFFETYVR